MHAVVAEHRTSRKTLQSPDPTDSIPAWHASAMASVGDFICGEDSLWMLERIKFKSEGALSGADVDETMFRYFSARLEL